MPALTPALKMRLCLLLQHQRTVKDVQFAEVIETARCNRYGPSWTPKAHTHIPHSTIRLLMIEDDGPFDLKSGSVSCKIQHFSLNDVPKYRALSYAWGDMTTKEISLDDRRMEVRTNLVDSFSTLENFTVGLTPFLDLPYWNRMWIVQEIGLASKITLLYDKCSTKWEGLHGVRAFMTALPVIRSNYLNYDGIASTRNRILKSQAFVLDQHRAEAKKNFLEVLIRTCESPTCSNPRDKVYALLGLAEDCNHIEFPIDYAKPLFEVHIDTLNFCTRHEGPGKVTTQHVISFSHTMQRSFGSDNEMHEEAVVYQKLSKSIFQPRFHTIGRRVGRVQEVREPVNREGLSAWLTGSLSDFPHCKQTAHHVRRDMYKLRPIISRDSIAALGNPPRHRKLQVDEEKPWHRMIRRDEAGEITTPFIMETGQIGYGGSFVNVADMIYQFEGSDVAIVIRQIPFSSPASVGRAFLAPIRERA